jgi:hypothetical protein
MPVSSGEVVLIDRYPASVITWVRADSAQVRAQLSVSTGFAANPHDYVELSQSKAYVTRYEPNFAAGSQPFDQGSDILVVDPSTSAIAGRVDLTPAMKGEDPRFFPRPGRAVRIADRVYAVLEGYSADFRKSAESRVIAVDTRKDTIEDVFVLRGMHGCGGLAVSPQEDALAVSCSGEFGGDSVPTLAGSGVVLLDVRQVLTERRRYAAKDFDQGSMGFSLSFSDADHLVFTTLGRRAVAGEPAVPDSLIQLDLGTDAFEVLRRSAEEPFTIGEVRCVSACSVCFIADAETGGGVVHRFDVAGAGRLVNPKQLRVESRVGLPPRHLGLF